MSRSERYCGRLFGAPELALIRAVIADHRGLNRAQLSRLVCEQLQWRRADGGLKDMSCRVAMLRMQADGLIKLPLPLKRNGNGKSYGRRTPGAEPDRLSVLDAVSARVDLRLQLVRDRRSSHLWNEYVDRYHYLGYQPLPGAQLRYFACAQDRPIALFGFAAAAWKIQARDAFIGWTPAQRQARLHLVVNNARFLILPWVRSRNLASRLLAMATRRLAVDWQERYGYRPLLVETFVEAARFRGTCYKAANWICLGETHGRGRRDVTHQALLPKKSVWVYPLAKHFRQCLCAPD